MALSSASMARATPKGLSAAAGSVVRTKRGELRGARVGDIHSFKGIPFAAPPIGTNRLRPPQPREPWDGVREALAFGPKPPQGPYPPLVAEMLPELVGPGDDCLTLNIWTRELGASARQPVMVWIPGGLFEYHGTGACPWYDGASFARNGVVCVTVNYRVGAEGFLYLGDGIANLGLLDQIAALEWVRDNITDFGGDPDQVTIFGESAGALSIGTLLGVPRAKGLFRRAIMESGGAQHVTAAPTAERIGRRLAEKMGVEPSRGAMAAAPRETMLAAQIALRQELEVQPDPGFWGEVAITNLPWQPTVDGDVLPGPPLDRIRAGAGRDVDLLAGSNTEETRMFLVPGGVIDRIAPEALSGLLVAYGLPVEEGLAAYRDLYSGATAGELFSAVQTDWYWRLPALRLSEAHAAQDGPGRTFMYEFAWRSPRFDGRLGAGHSLEIAFVFDSLGKHTGATHGDDPPQALSATMHRAWVAFARSGDPGWPQFDGDRRATMHFDAVSHVVDDPLTRERALWDGVR
jgi:carboxylesterase 2/para-nitrobenzyl esterase